MFGLKLVPNAAALHKSFTVILTLLATAISALQLVLPQIDESAKAVLEPTQYIALMIFLNLLIAVARYVQQNSVSGQFTLPVEKVEEKTEE